jgi:hypothetical protein
VRVGRIIFDKCDLLMFKRRAITMMLAQAHSLATFVGLVPRKFIGNSLQLLVMSHLSAAGLAAYLQVVMSGIGHSFMHL